MHHPEKPPIPIVFLDNSVEKLVPTEFSKLSIDEKNYLLEGFKDSIQVPVLREIALLNSIILIQNQSIETNPTDNSKIAQKILTIIMNNQTDRSLQPAWQTMLDKKTKLKSKDPLFKTLVKAGNTKYGMYGLALLPNKENDYTIPSFDVIPQAFSQWLKTLDSEDINYQIKRFQHKLGSIYSSSDLLKLNTLLISNLHFNKHSKKKRLFQKTA